MHIVDQIFTVLRDHCTDGEDGKRVFLEKVSEIIEGSTLAPRDSDALWAAIWEKPFYAGMKSGEVTAALQKAKSANVFDNYRDLHAPEWEVIVGKRLQVSAWGSRPRQLIDAGILTGPCRRGAKINAVTQIAKSLEHLTRLHNQAVAAAQAGTAANFGLVRDHTNALDAALQSIPDIARRTVLHMLTDLGYPIVKTDIWVCRFSSTFPVVQESMLKAHGIDLAGDNEKILERKLKKCEPAVFALFDQLTTEHSGQPEGITPDLNVMFRRYRFVDLIVAKFGMGAEDSFGLRRSGVEALMQDSALRRQYPELADKASILSRTLKKDAEKLPKGRGEKGGSSVEEAAV